MKSKKTILLLLCISISLLFFAESAFALVVRGVAVGSFIPFSFIFNFNNPGARASGMGGAFIAVADDATAAYTNPAGLVVLSRPEVAAEYKSTTTISPTVYLASSSPPPSYATKDVENTTTDPSFLSFSYPFERANITLYRHHLVNSVFDATVQNGPGFVSYAQSLDVVTYGLSAGYKISDKFSVGLSLGFDDFKTSNYYSTGSGNSTLYAGSDRNQHYIVSLLWSPIERFNVGLTYRYGPEFKYRTTYEGAGGFAFNYQIEDKTKIPDAYGVGVSYRFPFGLTLAADVNYIMYSQIPKRITYEDGSTRKNFSIVGLPDHYISTDDYKADDAYEAHVGLEYVFTVKEIPLALRGGYCYRQPNRIFFVSNPSVVALLDAVGIPSDQRPEVRMPKGKEEHLGSLGFGIVLGKNFQVDLAGTYGTFTREYIMSLVFRF